MKIQRTRFSFFDEAMDGIIEVRTMGELISYLMKHFPPWGPDTGNVTFSKCGGGVGWAKYVICINGMEALFADSPLTDLITNDDQEQRKRALELIGHPLNRTFFKNVLRSLKKDGLYGWPDMQMSFTYDEIKQALEDAKKKES